MADGHICPEDHIAELFIWHWIKLYIYQTEQKDFYSKVKVIRVYLSNLPYLINSAMRKYQYCLSLTLSPLRANSSSWAQHCKQIFRRHLIPEKGLCFISGWQDIRNRFSCVLMTIRNENHTQENWKRSSFALDSL